MKIHTFAVGLLTAALAGQVAPGRVWAVEVASGANSAETYREAFEAGEKTGVGKTEVMRGDVGTVAIDEKVRELLEGNKEEVALIRRAVGEVGCDWGDVSDLNKVMAELGRVRTAGRLMTLNARAEVAGKDFDGAVDDWLAVVAMGRRVGQMNLVVARLVGVAVESQAIDQMTAARAGLPEEAKKRMAEGWGRLPKGGTGREMVMGEYAYAQRAIVKQNVNKEWVTVLEPFYREIAGAADGPADRFEKVVDDQMAKFALNPFAQTVGPAIKRSRASLAKVEGKRAGLEAAMKEG